MPINASCQQCGATLPVPDEYAGQAVRCGGCQGVVNVPRNATTEAPPAAVPVARAVRARPVALPVATKTKAKPEPKTESPIRKARKVRDEDESAEESDEPSPERRPTRRPIARKRRESLLTPTAFKWLALFLVTGTVGLGVLIYARWSSTRKNDGTVYVPAADADVKPVPPMPRPAPVAMPPQPPVQFDPPVDRFEPRGAIDGPPVDDLKLPFKRSTNAVLKRIHDRCTVTASSQWQQWPASHAFDWNTSTSWFSNAQAAGQSPWIQVTFPEDTKISRVTILGNRDPMYLNNYTVRRVLIELLYENGKVQQSIEFDGQGPKCDYDWTLRGNTMVRSVRVTVLKADRIECVALGEIEIE